MTWEDAVVALRYAAVLHRFPVRGDGPIQVIVRSARRPIPGLLGLRLRLSDTDVDSLAGLPWQEALDLWAWVSTRRLVSRGALVHAASTGTGLVGTAQLVRLMARTRDGAVSEAEIRFGRPLRRGGLSGWAAGVTIWRRDGSVMAVVDVLFESAALVVEIDGRRWHEGGTVFQRDRERQNELALAVHTVLRFTWFDIVERPARVIAQLERALVIAARVPTAPR